MTVRLAALVCLGWLPPGCRRVACDYIARRIAEGKSRRDATRLLKRYLARHLYRLLQQTEPLMT